MTSNDGDAKETKQVSERTCVGCRQVAEREALVRFAIRAENGVAEIVPDAVHKLGGRGASTHATRACIEAGIKRGGFAKAASARVEITADALIAMLDAQLVQRAKGLLLGAIRGKAAVLGADSTEKAVAARRIVGLVLATDAAERTGAVAESLTRLGGRVVSMMTKSELGGLVGRDEVAVIGIEDEGIAAALAQVAVQIAGVRNGNQEFSNGEGSPSKVG